MPDLVEKFSTFEKNLASRKRAIPNRRKDKIDDLLPPWEIGVGSNLKYRDGWDRIFANKAHDVIQDESGE